MFLPSSSCAFCYLLFLLLGGSRSFETGKKSSLVGFFLHLHQTSQLLLGTCCHSQEKISERKKKTPTKHQQPAYLLNLAPLLDDHCHTEAAVGIPSPVLLRANSRLTTARNFPSCDIQFQSSLSLSPLWCRNTAHSIAKCIILAHRQAYLALHSLFCRLKEKIGYHAPILQ